MRTAILRSLTALAMMGAPSFAFATCTISDDKTEMELSKVEGINSGDFGAVRRDVRELRSAAMVLQRYGKDDACQNIVSAMSELLRDPKMALNARGKFMMPSSQTGKSAKMTEADPAADQTATDPAAKTAAEAPVSGSDATATTDTAVLTDAPVTPTPASPMSMDQRRDAAVPFTERKTVMSAAEMIGSDVYGADNQSVGEIDDIVVSPENKPSYALISYGGFLGMGEEQAAVPVSAIRISSDNYLFVQLTAEQLKGAPKLKRGTADWWTNDSFRAENDAYYTRTN